MLDRDRDRDRDRDGSGGGGPGRVVGAGSFRQVTITFDSGVRSPVPGG